MIKKVLCKLGKHAYGEPYWEMSVEDSPSGDTISTKTANQCRWCGCWKTHVSKVLVSDLLADLLDV